ncbi:hypothetical protein ABFA07_001478 [Porites harrisoni]
METPPNVPPFTERKVKRRKPTSASTAGETFVQLAEALTSASTGAHRSETRNQESSTNLRSVLLAQLKELGELHREGVLTQQEFDEQKQLLLIDLRNISQ